MGSQLLNEWQSFVKGDNKGLVIVFDTYYSTLLFTAFYYLKNEEQAKDMVSDVFTKLLSFSIEQRLDNLKYVDEKLEIFLKVLTKNRCLDFMKVENNRQNILNSIHSFFNRSTSTDSFFEKDFILLLDTLPYRQRQILELHLQGYDNSEISTELDISYNTVRNTLHTSKNKIRNLWKIFMT